MSYLNVIVKELSPLDPGGRLGCLLSSIEGDLPALRHHTPCIAGDIETQSRIKSWRAMVDGYGFNLTSMELSELIDAAPRPLSSSCVEMPCIGGCALVGDADVLRELILMQGVN